MSPGELAAATPLPIPSAELHLMTFERNAWRNRCHELERAIAYLLGREPEPAALDYAVLAVAQRDAVMALLDRAFAPLPAIP